MIYKGLTLALYGTELFCLRSNKKIHLGKAYSGREDEILSLLSSIPRTEESQMHDQIKSLIFKASKDGGNTLENTLDIAAKKDLSTTEDVRDFLANFTRENSSNSINSTLAKILLEKLNLSIQLEKSRRRRSLIKEVYSAIPRTMAIDYNTGKCLIPETRIRRIPKKTLEARINRILSLHKSSFFNHFIHDVGKYDFLIQDEDDRLQSISRATCNPIKILDEFCGDVELSRRISSIYNHKSVLYLLNTFNESLLVNSKNHPILMFCNSSSNTRHVGITLKKLQDSFSMEIHAILPLQIMQDSDSENQILFDFSLSSLNIYSQFLIKTKGSVTASIPEATFSMNGMIEWNSL